MTIILAILVFSIVIFIHEFGHFLAAKKSGVKVYEFSIGMGPAIYKHQGEETLYALRVLPIGGYCAMEGEDETSDHERSFEKASPFKRLLIIVSGALMNFLFALLLCVLMQTFIINHVVVDEVVEGSPASSIGLTSGDRILEINEKQVNTPGQAQKLIQESGKETIDLKIERNGLVENYSVDSRLDEESNNYQIGILMNQLQDFSVSNFSLLRGISQGFMQFYQMVLMLFQILGMLFTGQLGISNLAGPVGVVSEIGRQASYGVLSLLYFIAYINVNLGVLNLLPLPALDGGRALITIIEITLKKKLPKEKEALINGVGFLLLLILIVFVSINDVRRIF